MNFSRLFSVHLSNVLIIPAFMGRFSSFEKVTIDCIEIKRRCVTAQKCVEIKKNSRPYQGMEWPLF